MRIAEVEQPEITFQLSFADCHAEGRHIEVVDIAFRLAVGQGQGAADLMECVALPGRVKAGIYDFSTGLDARGVIATGEAFDAGAEPDLAFAAVIFDGSGDIGRQKRKQLTDTGLLGSNLQIERSRFFVDANNPIHSKSGLAQPQPGVFESKLLPSCCHNAAAQLQGFVVHVFVACYTQRFTGSLGVEAGFKIGIHEGALATECFEVEEDIGLICQFTVAEKHRFQHHVLQVYCCG